MQLKNIFISDALFTSPENFFYTFRNPRFEIIVKNTFPELDVYENEQIYW